MLHLPLKTVKYILNEFEKKLGSYSLKTYTIDKFQKCIVIVDSLVLFVGIIKSISPPCSNVKEMYDWTRDNKYMDYPNHHTDYYELYI